MGRKIPGKKHRGVKDPDKQREIRMNSLKHKINAAPLNPDDQDIPKSVTRIMELKEKIRNASSRKKPNNNFKLNRKNNKGRPEKPTPVFIQKKVIQETAFENKYGIDVKRNQATGEVEGIVKRKRDEIDELVRKAKKHKLKGNEKSKKIKKKDDNGPRLTKSQKRQKKLKEKKKSKANRNINEFAGYKDEIRFGEIVHAPPNLSKPRKVESTNSVARPGAKDLLLKTILKNGSEAKISSKAINTFSDSLKKTNNKIIDKKSKRKMLPTALRRQLDQQQEEVIKAYKLLKTKKYTS